MKSAAAYTPLYQLSCVAELQLLVKVVMGRKDGKPRGRMSAYAFFVQICREEHKKKHPGEPVVFADFSRRCASKWKVSCQ